MQFNAQIIAILSTVMGLGACAYLLMTLRRLRAAKYWPMTTGEILESCLDDEADGWAPQIRYAYTVNGKRYETDRIYFYLSNYGYKRDAIKELAPYSVGKQVVVYYNPDNHAYAVLDRSVPLLRHALWGIFAAFWLFFAVIMLLGE